MKDSIKSDDHVEVLTVSDDSYGSLEDGLAHEEDEQMVSRFAAKVIITGSCVNVFLSSLDSTLVSTLLGIIASDLQSLDNISWIATSYLLSCSAFQPLFGKLSDVFGRKSMILLCEVLFAIGCAWSAWSKDLMQLILARFVTGIGGGGLNALSSITVSDIVPLRKRGVYQGFINVFFYLGAITGGMAAGIFEKMIGWRMAFLIQAPVVLLNGMMILKYFNLPKGAPGLGIAGTNVWNKLKTIDYFGSFTLVASLFGLMVALSVGGKEIAFSDPKFAVLIITSSACLLVFYYYDLKVCADPIIPVRLLHNRTVLMACLAAWFVSMNIFCCTYYLPFYWTSVKNLTPLESGIRLIPSMIFSAMGSISAGYIIKKTCSYHHIKLSAGVITVIGSVLVYMSQPSDSSVWDSLVSVPVRYSTSCIVTTLLIAMLSAVEPDEQAQVTSILYCFRSTGFTLGVSLSAAILQLVLKGSLISNLGALQSQFPEALLRKSLTQALKDPGYAFTADIPEIVKSAVVDAYNSACHGTFVFLVVTSILTLLFMLLIKDHDLRP